jgi:DNA-directed RNA polymerase sigma subunit (sigma70/sigma32)
VRGQRKRTLPHTTRDKTTRDETPARAGYTLGGHLPPLLSSADELALCARIQAGDRDARNELVEANIRLARRCASLFLASRRTIGALTLDDLIQEALLGVIRAAERYDGRGKFSTVAVWWIKQSLSRALDAQAEMIRVPTYIATRTRRCARARHNWRTRGSRSHGARWRRWGSVTMRST